MTKSYEPFGFIRQATESDLKIIESWLPTNREVPSLAVNWAYTLQQYARKGMQVWEEAGTGIPIAYCWGSLNDDGIFEVHPDRRGTGVGKAFARHLLQQSLASGEGLLQIQCSPESSVAFWAKMGFTVEKIENQWIGRQILHIPQALPQATLVDVAISFYREDEVYARGTEAEILQDWHIDAARCPITGKLILSEKVFGFDIIGSGELVVKVVVGGNQVYFGRAKNYEAEEFGFTRCKNGFVISALSDQEFHEYD